MKQSLEPKLPGGSFPHIAFLSLMLASKTTEESIVPVTIYSSKLTQHIGFYKIWALQERHGDVNDLPVILWAALWGLLRIKGSSRANILLRDSSVWSSSRRLKKQNKTNKTPKTKTNPGTGACTVNISLSFVEEHLPAPGTWRLFTSWHGIPVARLSLMRSLSDRLCLVMTLVPLRIPLVDICWRLSMC